jgi:ribonuclease III
VTDAGGDPVANLEQAMGYRFETESLLHEALTHPSYTAEYEGSPDYDRLEFLGDAVLQLAVTRYLYGAMPDASEGEMTLVRASVVAEPALAHVGKAWNVPDAIRFGRGEELSGGRDKDSIISNVVEALLGVVFIEAGFDRAEQIISNHWGDMIDERSEAPGGRDYKTRLQEVLVAAGQDVSYAVISDGPQHAKTFTATVQSGGEQLATGTGSSKKRAEQAAARIALKNLATPDP